MSVSLLDSDSGGDEKGNKLLVHGQTQRNPNVSILDPDCLLHQYQLSVKSGLQLADSILKEVRRYKYFAILSKVMTVWREHAAMTYQMWSDRYGALAAVPVSRVPPKCISGRWGQSHIAICTSVLVI